MQILHYLTVAGVDPFQSWLESLADVKARVSILRRIDRLVSANFGDHKCVLRKARKGCRVITKRRFETLAESRHRASRRIFDRFQSKSVMTQKPSSSRSHEQATLDSLARDPAFAAEYLNAVLDDGNEKELMLALRRVADARGGISVLATKSKLNVTTLYRTLSAKGNPELKSMNSILRAMGLRLAIEPRERGRARKRTPVAR